MPPGPAEPGQNQPDRDAAPAASASWGPPPDPTEAVRAACAALAEHLRVAASPEPVTDPIEVLRVETRVLLRRGERVYAYLVGPDARVRLEPSDEKDGGRFMVRPPRMQI